MLFFLTLLISPFFPQEGMVVETAYVQEDNSDESDEDGSVVLLGYKPSGHQSGKIMNISATSDSDDESEDDSDDASKTDSENENDEDVIQNVKATSKDMNQRMGQMRMIQLANTIAQDMGIILQVSYDG